jgi:Putative zinc-finger
VRPCPEIDELLAVPPMTAATAAHFEGCAACSALVALTTFRGIGARVSDAPEVCAAFEPAIAALVDGTLGAEDLAALIEHLGRCGACNDLAARLTLFRGELDDVAEPEVETWGKEKVMQAIDVEANVGLVSVEATPVNETTEVRPRPVVVLDGPARWRQRAHWAAAVAAGVAIGLIGGGAIFLRRGEVASVATPPAPGAPTGDASAARPGGAYVGDIATRLDQLEKRARAAEERAELAELRVRMAEARVKHLESRVDPAPEVAPSSTGHVYGPFPLPRTGPELDHAGYLTIVCNPSCDDVIDNGRSVGASPIVHLEVAPGRHKLAMRHGTTVKSLSVIVPEGEIVAQRIDMR